MPYEPTQRQKEYKKLMDKIERQLPAQSELKSKFSTEPSLAGDIKSGNILGIIEKIGGAESSMPQEPQSGTPRTDKQYNAVPEHKKTAWTEAMANFARTLERELNEANRALNKFVLDNIANGKVRANLLIEQERLQQELAKVRGELVEAQQWLDSEPDWKNKFMASYLEVQKECDLLAKQNHNMMEALLGIKKVSVFEDGAEVRILKTQWVEFRANIKAATDSMDTSSLTVLSRAEVESWPCKCFDRSGNSSNDVGIIKCTKHTLLERFTK